MLLISILVLKYGRNVIQSCSLYFTETIVQHCHKSNFSWVVTCALWCKLIWKSDYINYLNHLSYHGHTALHKWMHVLFYDTGFVWSVGFIYVHWWSCTSFWPLIEFFNNVHFSLFPLPILQEPGASAAEDIAEIRKLLQNEIHMRKTAEEELNKLKSRLGQYTESGVWFPVLNYCFVHIFKMSFFFLFLFFLIVNWKWRYKWDIWRLVLQRCRNVKTSQNLGGWDTSKKETWRRNSDTTKPAIAVDFWSWSGIWLEIFFLFLFLFILPFF